MNPSLTVALEGLQRTIHLARLGGLTEERAAKITSELTVAVMRCFVHSANEQANRDKIISEA